ncbi:hypothetical protein [Thalassomonas actiniarum]|uniref:Uncharacterized protein n=1 Tax=Thalassomonas actiniarum TaxID=485447 RepID=A0AAE9YW95_9GAMM|nr:hypothetical protein [Thalassomonas actiniarum]WDE02346.1 hypothetical protein SG35_031850 [Thalassomonas actiniarum]
MKKYFLACAAVLTAFLTGYFFAGKFNVELVAVKPARPATAVTGQVMVAGDLADGQCSADKEQLARLQQLLNEKEQQLDSQQQALLAMQTLGERYQVMMAALGDKGYFRGPRILENFQANDMFFEFFQLSPEQEQAIKEVSANALLSIQDWEILNAYLLTKDDKKIVYEIPVAAEEAQGVKNKLIDDLVTVLGEENRELSHQFLGDLFEQFAFKRIVTLQVLRARDPAVSSQRFKLRVKMFDTHGQRRRSAANTYGQIPKRFSHLFNEFSSAHQ